MQALFPVQPLNFSIRFYPIFFCSRAKSLKKYVPSWNAPNGAPAKPPIRALTKAPFSFCRERRHSKADELSPKAEANERSVCRRCGERKKERNGRSFPRRGKRSRVEFLLTTPSPQPSYIRGWGLTTGFDCPRAFTFAFFRRLFHRMGCVGVPPETVVSLFPQTMVGFRLNLASVAFKSVFGTSRGYVSLCVSQSQKEVGAVLVSTSDSPFPFCLYYTIDRRICQEFFVRIFYIFSDLGRLRQKAEPPRLTRYPPVPRRSRWPAHTSSAPFPRHPRRWGGGPPPWPRCCTRTRR